MNNIRSNRNGDSNDSLHEDDGKLKSNTNFSILSLKPLPISASPHHPRKVADFHPTEPIKQILLLQITMPVAKPPKLIKPRLLQQAIDPLYLWLCAKVIKLSVCPTEHINHFLQSDTVRILAKKLNQQLELRTSINHSDIWILSKDMICCYFLIKYKKQ